MFSTPGSNSASPGVSDRATNPPHSHDFPFPRGTDRAAISGGFSVRQTARTNARWKGSRPSATAAALGFQSSAVIAVPHYPVGPGLSGRPFAPAGRGPRPLL